MIASNSSVAWATLAGEAGAPVSLRLHNQDWYLFQLALRPRLAWYRPLASSNISRVSNYPQPLASHFNLRPRGCLASTKRTKAGMCLPGQWRQWSSVSVTWPRWSLWQCQCWQQPPAGRGPELLSLNFSRPRRRPQRAGGRAPLDTAAPRDFSWTFTTIHYATLSK